MSARRDVIYICLLRFYVLSVPTVVGATQFRSPSFKELAPQACIPSSRRSLFDFDRLKRKKHLTETSMENSVRVSTSFVAQCAGKFPRVRPGQAFGSFHSQAVTYSIGYVRGGAFTRNEKHNTVSIAATQGDTPVNRGRNSYEFSPKQMVVFASIVRTLTFVAIGNMFYGVMRLCLAGVTLFERTKESGSILSLFRLSDLDSIIPNIIEIYVATIILKSADALREILSSKSPDNVETLVYSMSLFDKALKRKKPPIFLKAAASAGALVAAIKVAISR